MKYSAKTKPGMADPYWYEWSVGQKYIVEMLNPDSHIQYVELQADVQLGLDDVVVTYDNGKTRFIQVKHTRVDNTITFGDLVSVDRSKKETKSQCSLLEDLARSWNSEKDRYADSEVYIFTNRTVGNRASLSGKGRSIKRPPLNIFLKELKEKLIKAENFSDLVFPNNREAWEEWCNQLKDIENDEDKLTFLNNLHIETKQESLEELGNSIKNKLQSYFLVSEEISDILLGKLDHALREWTTSNRGSSKITIEKLYSALSIKEEVVKYNHDLIPVNPFFDSRNELVNNIEENILDGDEKVIYLSGVPGTGKTNVISKLCSKKDSIIDIRYYAYEPIDPSKEYLPSDVSERVKKEVFWDTLLNQLRELLIGNLYKYKVPVSNSFLKLKEKKKEFFRIASEYAKDRKRIFVIAVDGLDHAARAGVIEETFLSTLPNPEYIPDNVKIIIAGQPKEDYRNYPDWLYTDSHNIKEYVVPDIQPGDIEELVNERCNNFSASNKLIVSDIICRYAGGNTLSAIFAVHESLNCSNPTSFEERLESRKLSGNIQEYYRTIWEDTKKKMQIPFVDYKIAGVFAFFNEPITAAKLKLIFKDEGISCSSWNNILKALSPLLIERNGTYTILHNDIRVYLSGIIGRDQDHVREVYSGLADYYLSQEEKTIGFYRDVIRFLVSADRVYEFSTVYTPEYVLNGYVNGIELGELSHITGELMKYVINEECIDWHKFLSLSLGYLTIEQIQKSSDEIEDLSFRKSIKVISVHPYECYITPVDKWSFKILSEVLQLINDLFENGEEVRGKTLFLNWFDDTNLSDFQKIMNDENEDYNPWEGRSIAKLLSRSCVNSEYFGLFKNISNLERDRFLNDVVENIEGEIIEKLRAEKLEKALDSLDVLLIDPLINGVKILFEKNRYEDLKIVRNSIQKRRPTNSTGKMVLAFLKIITGDADWDDEQSDIIWNEIESVNMPEKSNENLMNYYSIYAIVASYIQNKSRLTIAQEITDKYIGEHKYKKTEYFLLYFNAVTYLGKWLKSKSKKTEINESVNDLMSIVVNLYCKSWNPSEIDFKTFDLRGYILKAYAILSEDENTQFQDAIRNSFEKVFEYNPVNQLLDPGMLYYRHNPERMQLWIDEWLDDNGKVWSEYIGDRNSIIKKFIEMKEKYDQNNELYLRSAVERVKWSVIGFASHKEYCVDYLLNWYNNIIDRFPKYISKYAEVVKDISDKVEVLGDNRFEYKLNSRIYSDWGSEGSIRIKSILKNRALLNQCLACPSYIIDMLVGYLKESECDEKQLLTIWAIGIGLLDWRNEDDHYAISQLQRSIETCAGKNGLSNIKKEMLKLGPAYIDLSTNPMKDIISDKWCGKEKNSKDLDNANEILTSYLTNSKDSHQKYEVAKALKKLHSGSRLNESLKRQIFSTELSKINYGINHNSILEFMFEVANDSDIDDYIRQYIGTAIDNDRFYPTQVLPVVIGWGLKNKAEDYNIECLEQLIKMFRCWITASNHIKEPDLEEVYDYSQYVNFETEDMFGNLMKILLLIVKSDDADRARVSVGGIAAFLRVNISYISIIEKYWNTLHYRAKEWILMVYEFIYELCPEYREMIYEFLVLHSKDDDFNAAIYAKLLCENINPEYSLDYCVEKKDYFSSIPLNGEQTLIHTLRNGPYINGNECVLEQKSLIEERLCIDLMDVERRTADYSEKIAGYPTLIPLFRLRTRGTKVVCDKVNLAFLRVLYKDWYYGRWNGIEAELARFLLSASEPLTMLLSPYRWKWNDGKIFNNPKDIISLSEKEKNSSIDVLFNTGINSDEIVLAGTIADYSDNQQLFGYTLSYLDVPEMNEQHALQVFERNARLFLKKREDYTEYISINVTMHHNGIESFKQSNIMCGFSKSILLALGWEIKFGPDGLEIVNSNNQIVGRLECFYGFRTDIGNRCRENQPYLQRWIVNKNIWKRAFEQSGCQFQVKTSTGSLIMDF
ncbi:hypothetical protein [Facklamia sp. 7083-14-GEN3]|uniref:hypothetical protein n=1 Tax=Facklamia sp. 7083-14-GEN3 TaxID=2973478 RepID=UPI00215D1D7F|nr:hypothetical protein [Facklamia sp. 7083-14-GEN3]MCR8969792.1 hypothetical protein [Facklamia sp. 7083-14-GEN3]